MQVCEVGVGSNEALTGALRRSGANFALHFRLKMTPKNNREAQERSFRAYRSNDIQEVIL